MNEIVASDSLDIRSLLIDELDLKPGEATGKTVLITGAGRGIGFQAGRAFAALGGRVIIAELSSQLGKEAETAICSQGGQALFIQTDVSNQAHVARLAEKAHEVYGKVDILINNAIYCPVSKIVDMDLETWDRVIAVNLRGAFLTCKAFLPDMIESGAGVIVNMVSTDAMPGLSAYIASKTGMSGFSQSLALEVASAGIKIIPFAPGMVDTPAIRDVSVALAPQLGLTQDQFLHMSLHPAYEGLMPAEHAGAATAYLILRLAGEYHGQSVDGYEVLEKAGLLKPAQIDLQTTQGQPAVSTKASPKQPVGELAGQVIRILEETEAEFSRLPVFVRPMARSGFKSKAVWSVNDWRLKLKDLQSAYRAGQPLPPGFQDRLQKLIAYYQAVPKETARFTRDAEMLRQVAELSNQRIAVIQNLANAIEDQTLFP
jgi:NAD(P)-dependent dehydrogenase (short-subunit alcohol dehydrogenase family)